MLAQRDDSARALLSAGATAEIVGFVGSHARAADGAAVRAVVGCLRHLLLTLPALRDGVAYTEARAPLKQLCDLGPTGDKKLDDGVGAVSPSSASSAAPPSPRRRASTRSRSSRRWGARASSSPARRRRPSDV